MFHSVIAPITVLSKINGSPNDESGWGCYPIWTTLTLWISILLSLETASAFIFQQRPIYITDSSHHLLHRAVHTYEHIHFDILMI